MESPNRPYVRELDELRGIAALLVFLYHALHASKGHAGTTAWLQSTTPPLALVFEGHTGVALFMVLSGFVLARGTFDKPIAYGQFLKNRALRIFPLMIFVLVFAVYGNHGYTLDSLLAPFLFSRQHTVALQRRDGAFQHDLDRVD